MNTYRPRRPTGTSAQWMFFKAVWDLLWGGKFPFIDTDSVKWNRSDAGYSARAALSSGGGGSANGHIRGEYISSGDYLTDDIVVVASGANAGSYACVKDHPGSGNAPWVGGGWWIKLASGNALGQWM